MTVRQLHNLLRGLDDTRELVVSPGPGDDVHFQVWRVAQDEAAAAYADWRDLGGPEAYHCYRASADRADAAMDALLPQPRWAS